MQNNRHTKKEIKAGKKLRDEILAHLAARGVHPSPDSALPHPHEYMRADNILSVVVQPRNGGWVTDIVFRDVPADSPSCLGSKDAFPFATRQAAREASFVNVERLVKASCPTEGLVPVKLVLVLSGKKTPNDGGPVVHRV